MNPGPAHSLVTRGKSGDMHLYNLWLLTEAADEEGQWFNPLARKLSHLYPGIDVVAMPPTDGEGPHVRLLPEWLDESSKEHWNTLTIVRLNECLYDLRGKNIFIAMEPHRTDSFIYMVACSRNPNLFDENAIRSIPEVRRVRRVTAPSDPAGYDYQDEVLRVYAPGANELTLHNDIKDVLRFD